MFVTVVGAAIRTTPNLKEIVLGLRPIIPDGGILYMLGIAGGVGGTITLLTYGVLGVLFMPFLAVTLLFLLNRRVDEVASEWRNGWLSNSLLELCALLFFALAVNEVRNQLAPYVPLW